MKKVLLVSVLLSFVLLSLVSAQPSMQTNYNNNPSSGQQGIVVTELNYQPYPVNPGEYFDLWIQAQYIGAGLAPNATFTLNPTFPFSLDSNQNATYSFYQLGSTPVLLHYLVRVDPNAVQGENQLQLEYSPSENSNYLVQTFNIQVADSQTNFDSVIQDSTSTATSIGIANIGENTANSLIVRIPSQQDFRVVGTNGQIVGNLNSGDYTIATFDIVPMITRGNTTIRNNNETLQVELDYTDAIGVRRTVMEYIPFSMTSTYLSNLTSGSLPTGSVFGNGSTYRRSSTSIFGNAWFWIVVSAVIVIAGVFMLTKFKKKKQNKKDLDHSKKILDGLKTKDQDRKDSKEPDWVVSERTKKK
ncbi:MAG: hypothetical protein WAU65_00700 [Candidatus Nanoarchaeia archaeon]